MRDINQISAQIIDAGMKVHSARAKAAGKRLRGLKAGLLINLKVPHLKDGLKRTVNKLEPPRPSAPSAVKLTVLHAGLERRRWRAGGYRLERPFAGRLRFPLNKTPSHGVRRVETWRGGLGAS